MLALKARPTRAAAHLSSIRASAERRLAHRLRILFREQAKRVVRRLLGKPEKASSDSWTSFDVEKMEHKAIEDDLWPSSEEVALRVALHEALSELVIDIIGGLVDEYGDISLPFTDIILQQRIAESATRVRWIDNVTQRAIQRTLAEGRALGLSDWQIAYGSNQHPEFRGLRSVVEEVYKGRAQTIARTEIANSSNLTQVDWSRHAGYTRMRVSDGNGCGWSSHSDSRKANGMIVTLEEAAAHPTAHANCRRSMVPIVSSRDFPRLRVVQ